MRNTKILVALALGLPVLLLSSACSGTPAVAPLPNSVGQSAQQERLSSSSSPYSFASLVGKDITDADIERFIDKTVVGADRAFAKALMKTMPKNARGDFVYVSSTGRVLSNRPAIRDAFTKEQLRLPVDPRPAGIHPEQQFPPPTQFNTGPYIREYSVLGVTATTAYVFVPCADSIFNQGDEGVLYSGGVGRAN